MRTVVNERRFIAAQLSQRSLLSWITVVAVVVPRLVPPNPRSPDSRGSDARIGTAQIALAVSRCRGISTLCVAANH